MKFQNDNQLKGRWGELIAALAFPTHWVVRPLPHDYGIDLQVEVFDHAPTTSRGVRYLATGGHFSCQVKTSDRVVFKEERAEIRLRTADLRLAEDMGASAPLLLLLVDRPQREVYYLCLVDYIKYVLDQENPRWREQQTASVKIPSRNRLSHVPSADFEDNVTYLRSLAFRAKLYSVSFAFLHAHHEMGYALDRWSYQREFGGVADMQEAASSMRACLEAGRSACVATKSTGLDGEGSPFSGLLASADRWVEQFGSEWVALDDAVQALDQDLAVEDLSVARAVMAYDRCVQLAVPYFDSVLAAPRTFEGLLRRSRVSAAASPLET